MELPGDPGRGQRVRVALSLHWNRCACTCVHGHGSGCVHMYACKCRCVHVCVHMCGVRAFVHASACGACVHSYACTCAVCTHVCMQVHVCAVGVCVRAHVCACLVGVPAFASPPQMPFSKATARVGRCVVCEEQEEGLEEGHAEVSGITAEAVASAWSPGRPCRPGQGQGWRDPHHQV